MSLLSRKIKNPNPMAAAPTSNPSIESASTKSSSPACFIHNMDELQKIFNRFDSNGDGKISVGELGNVLKSMGSNYTDEELHRVIKDVDTDKDGFINLDEFADLCRSSSSTSATDELRDAFNLYDQNKNGLISSAELHQVLNCLGMKCSVEECVKMIKNVDSDGDGSVNFEEFRKMMVSNVSNGVAGRS
uniref:Putative calcium-binding protein CML27 n=1 Tax=Rhizophora mucronata TaxID=61149 RepID=A0A2P2MYK5_RHIMU